MLWLFLLQSLYMAIVIYGPAIALEAGNFWDNNLTGEFI